MKSIANARRRCARRESQGQPIWRCRFLERGKEGNQLSIRASPWKAAWLSRMIEEKNISGVNPGTVDSESCRMTSVPNLVGYVLIGYCCVPGETAEQLLVPSLPRPHGDTPPWPCASSAAWRTRTIPRSGRKRTGAAS